MEDAADTRRRISIIVAQTYQERRRHVVFSAATPKDSVVTFPSHVDHSFQHLRRLHHKGVQAVVEVVEGACQTEVRVPWSRWVETTPPTLPSQDEEAPQVTISPEVLARVEAAVQETAAVDVLSDDWGQLGLVDRSAALLLKPFNLPGKGSAPSRLAAAAQGDEPEGEKAAHEGEEGEEEEEEEEPSSPDILKLQMLQRKMMRRINERRAAARAAETVVQRFSRHYKARLAALDEGRDAAGGGEEDENAKEEEEEEEQVEKEEEEGEGEEQGAEDDEDGEYESIGTPSIMPSDDEDGW
ncbi:sodium/potassium/calcium exchanger 1-like isoform X2 [Eriocheir sinensis]|uniref:sodium/potassium/calcium exchanger 1-like isoform X2 n=1 Tax=Eriocheir sinensis TaxID=95602 RepID=UPI0021C9FAC1|nr:sodium/potassium/calcium exchanger 1-like isoform X2 [Eriocheir sinensis]